MSIELTYSTSVLIVFGFIFAAMWLAKRNSTVIDAIVYILAALLFVVVILATVGRMFH